MDQELKKKKLELLIRLQRRRTYYGILLMDLEEKQKSRTKKKWHVHPVNQKRRQYGAYRTLIQGDLREDVERFRDCLRLSPSQFDQLAKKVEPYLQKEVMYRNDVISPEERLAVTLR